MHAHEMHAYEIHAREMHVYEMHAREVHTYEMHARQVHARQMHAHEVMLMKCMPMRRMPMGVIAEEPETKSVIKDELFQELENIIQKVGSGGEVEPGILPG
jgi:hypothetical protein